MRNGRDHSSRVRVGGARVLMFACAASAGAHAGLVPAHLNGEPRLGFAFAVASLLLMTGAIAVAARPWDRRITGAAGLLLGGLVLAYLASRTTGIPLLDPQRESLDVVGVVTNVVEAIGLLAVPWLIQPVDRAESTFRTTGGLR